MRSRSSPVFEAWLEADDGDCPLDEYQVSYHPREGKEPPWAECYVQIIDQPFIICLKKVTRSKKGAQYAYLPDVHVDRQCLNAPVWPDSNKEWGMDKILEQIDGNIYSSDLTFALMPTTADETAITVSKQDLELYGSITIELERGTYTKCTPSNSVDDEEDTFETGVVHEDIKKIPWMIAPGARTRRSNKGLYDWDFDSAARNSKCYRFVFKYRSATALSSLGLVVTSTAQHDRQLVSPLAGPAGATRAALKRERKRRHAESQSEEGQQTPQLEAQETAALAEADDAEKAQQGEEEEDVKPVLKRRVEYLEERLKRAMKLLKSRPALGEGAEIIDLTED